jgi:hypothetical protein
MWGNNMLMGREVWKKEILGGARLELAGLRIH